MGLDRRLPGRVITGQPALEIAGLTRRSGGTVALDTVSARFDAGRICGPVGINGSGKSRMIGIVAGIEQPTDLAGPPFCGRPHHRGRMPRRPRRGGCRRGRFGAFGWKAAHDRVRATLAALGPDIDPHRRFDRFSPAQRTMALIARLLHDDGTPGRSRRIAILDEPTAALPEAEAIRLLDRLKERKAAGHRIVHVSHRLDELFHVADDLTGAADG